MSSVNRNQGDEVELDPIISRSVNIWRRSLSLKNWWLESLALASFFPLRKLVLTSYFPWQLGFWLITLLIFRIDVFLKNIFSSLIKEADYPREDINRRVGLWLIWMVGLVMVSKIGWFSLNLDPGTDVFLVYLPAVWLFKIPRTINGLLALMVLVFVPILLIGNYEKTAEIFAVIVYFLLVTAVVQGFRELKAEND